MWIFVTRHITSFKSSFPTAIRSNQTDPKYMEMVQNIILTKVTIYLPILKMKCLGLLALLPTYQNN